MGVHQGVTGARIIPDRCGAPLRRLGLISSGFFAGRTVFQGQPKLTTFRKEVLHGCCDDFVDFMAQLLGGIAQGALDQRRQFAAQLPINVVSEVCGKRRAAGCCRG